MPLSEEDKAIFKQAMKDVTPLVATDKHYHYPKKRINTIALTPPNRQLNSSSEIPLPPIQVESIEADIILSYKTAALSDKQFKKLKLGKMPYHSKLDLHQLTLEQAHASIIQFLSRCRRANHTCCLIIHGKGSGKIKGLIQHLLPNLSYVKAFHSAIPNNGGSGAVYVLLKTST